MQEAFVSSSAGGVDPLQSAETNVSWESVKKNAIYQGIYETPPPFFCDVFLTLGQQKKKNGAVRWESLDKELGRYIPRGFVGSFTPRPFRPALAEYAVKAAQDPKFWGLGWAQIPDTRYRRHYVFFLPLPFLFLSPAPLARRPILYHPWLVELDTRAGMVRLIFPL